MPASKFVTLIDVPKPEESFGGDEVVVRTTSTVTVTNTSTSTHTATATATATVTARSQRKIWKEEHKPAKVQREWEEVLKNLGAF